MKKHNLLGRRFNRLLVIAPAQSKNGRTFWNCQCNCGNQKEIATTPLLNGLTQSCGCLHKERVSEAKKTHGQSKNHTTPEYVAWLHMKSRCYNENNDSYGRYGGRGITVCERWLESFENFFADIGKRPEGMSLERIDNSQGYTPQNCKWATVFEQANNKRNNFFVIWEGQKFTLANLARATGANYGTLAFFCKIEKMSGDAAMARIESRKEVEIEKKV